MSDALKKVLSELHQHLSDCLIYGEVQAPKAVDCSGFSQSVYYLNGIILLRDASLQALHGMNVDISQGYGQLKPGDLLFSGQRKIQNCMSLMLLYIRETASILIHQEE